MARILSPEYCSTPKQGEFVFPTPPITRLTPEQIVERLTGVSTKNTGEIIIPNPFRIGYELKNLINPPSLKRIYSELRKLVANGASLL